MNEQHTQAYLNLIEQQLNCASQRELQQCFTDNQEFLERKLVQGMNQVVMAARGN